MHKTGLAGSICIHPTLIANNYTHNNEQSCAQSGLLIVEHIDRTVSQGFLHT